MKVFLLTVLSFVFSFAAANAIPSKGEAPASLALLRA